MKIISDNQIAHHSETRGIVITRQQIIDVDGQLFRADYWSDFQSGAIHHIDSTPLKQPKDEVQLEEEMESEYFAR